MPIVRITMFEGRTKEQKQELARVITEAVVNIAKTTPDATEVKDQILQKVLLVRSLRLPPPPASRRQVSGAWSADGKPTSEGRIAVAYAAPKLLVAIGSSTGGPSALLEIFGRLPATSSAAVVVAQHMPDKFTRTFAERLDRRGAFRTSEAQDGDLVARATGFVCPGRQCMEVSSTGAETGPTPSGPRGFFA